METQKTLHTFRVLINLSLCFPSPKMINVKNQLCKINFSWKEKNHFQPSFINNQLTPNDSFKSFSNDTCIISIITQLPYWHYHDTISLTHVTIVVRVGIVSWRKCVGGIVDTKAVCVSWIQGHITVRLTLILIVPCHQMKSDSSWLE